MSEELIQFGNSLIRETNTDILKLNALTEKFGLTLSSGEAAELVEYKRQSALKNGRIEFEKGISEKIIRAFCDSPYINAQEYKNILEELFDCFFYYKNESDRFLSDDELIDFMVSQFNGSCQGSMKLLSETSLMLLTEGMKKYGRNYYLKWIQSGKSDFYEFAIETEES